MIALVLSILIHYLTNSAVIYPEGNEQPTKQVLCGLVEAGELKLPTTYRIMEPERLPSGAVVYDKVREAGVLTRCEPLS